MNTFLGVKEVRALPMTRRAYNALRGWPLPEDENGDDEGYLVEYLDGGKANHPGFEGYISWSPAEVFANAYRRIDGMTFGLAVEAVKLGHRVARTGWNGKGMWISLSGHLSGSLVAAENFWSLNNADFARENGGKAHVEPTITMKTARGTIQMGWSPTISDVLAEDWVYVV